MRASAASWSKASCSSSDSFSSLPHSLFAALVLTAKCFRTRGSREYRHSSNQYECQSPSPGALSQPLVKVAGCTSLSIASAARYRPGGLIAEPTNRRRAGTLTFRPLAIGRESGGCAHSCTEKQSVLSFRVPDSSRGRTYRTASYLVETRVNKITLQPLPPETFNPPDGYSKLQNLPLRTEPPDISLLMSNS